MSELNITAIILAAGRSRRMGTFKPLLKFGDSTVIDCCIQNFRDVGVEQIVVVAGHRADELRGRLHDVTIVNNPQPDADMSSSIRLGVQVVSAESKAVLITPVDHPAVPPQVISELITEWKTGAKLVVPEYDGHGGHPVIVDLTFREELLKVDQQLNGLRGFFEVQRSEVVRMPVESPYIARDMDTWDDYVALHQELFGSPPAEQKSLE